MKQINTPELVFRFLVKFYTPDPELLEEELTRLLPIVLWTDCGSSE